MEAPAPDADVFLVIQILFGVTVALFVTISVATLLHQRWARRLPALAPLPAIPNFDGSNTGVVRCSAVVAARNEEARLEGTTQPVSTGSMAPIEPIRFIGHASPTALLLQNGRFDNLVPVAEAQELHTAASVPKTIFWHDAGHGLNQQALFDRLAWLHGQIGLDAPN
jgi:hypothetical protein